MIQFLILTFSLSVPLYCGPAIVNFSAGINYLHSRPDYADIEFSYKWLDRQNQLTNGMTTHEMITRVARESSMLSAFANRTAGSCELLPGKYATKLNRNILVVTSHNLDPRAFCGGYASAMCRVVTTTSYEYSKHKAQRDGYTQVIYVNNNRIKLYEVYE